MEAYSYLSMVYDELMMDIAYNDWADYINGLLDINGVSEKASILEVGCGTGSVTVRLKKKGYDIVGLDISHDMLRKAEEKARKEGVDIPFICQDLNEIDLHKKMDAIVAVCDVVNYVEEEKLKRFLLSAYEILKEDGVLLFDISSEYKLKNILGNNTFFEDREDITYIWSNKLNDEKINMDLTMFIKEGEVFKRYDEKHVQSIYSENSLLEALENSGFKDVKAYNCFETKKPSRESERIQFVAVKA